VAESLNKDTCALITDKNSLSSIFRNSQKKNKNTEQFEQNISARWRKQSLKIKTDADEILAVTEVREGDALFRVKTRESFVAVWTTLVRRVQAIVKKIADLCENDLACGLNQTTLLMPVLNQRAKK